MTRNGQGSISSALRILHVVGARPNFMKLAPVYVALKGPDIEQFLVHTGQHYSSNLSDVFFTELGIPSPDVNLGVGSGSHAQQTARTMERLENVLESRKPDLVLVYGDVNSTVAAALVCAKALVPLGHVEAGLRSFDRTMPEEINRLLTDQLASLLFTPSTEGDYNLLREGVPQSKIFRVGNVMIDTLVRLLVHARKPSGFELPPIYVLVTLHRPSNVDEREWLNSLLEALSEISRELPVVFPIHPRTRLRIQEFGLKVADGSLLLTEPLPYLEFLYLQKNAAAVVTDSGGVQEETTYLGTPCLTIRDNTERPVTVEVGTNTLVGRNCHELVSKIREILAGRYKKGSLPELWDGLAAVRIAQVIRRCFLPNQSLYVSAGSIRGKYNAP
jgi:UDP-N-acetylglucosamine 2-epimerase (non-hydrolysing)